MSRILNVKNYLSIEHLVQTEGKLQFNAKSYNGLGHVLYVKDITISAYYDQKTAILTSNALATDTTYQVAKGHGLVVGGTLGYSKNSKNYTITAINTSNGSYDIITLQYTLGIALTAGDTLVQSFESGAVSYDFGTTLNSVFVGDDYTIGFNQKLQLGSSITVSVNKILQQGESIFVQRGTSEKIGNIGFHASAYKISADTNFQAERVMYCLGDSVANLSGYVTRFGGHHHWIAKDILNNVKNATYPKGYDCRIVSDSMSGKTSTDLVNSLKSGMKVIAQADLILFQYGINDAYQGTSDITWQANIDYLISWKDKYYPEAKLVLVGATLLKDTETAQIARLAQLRTQMAAKANPTNNVYYINLGDSWLSSDYSKFTDGVHPTQAGQDAAGLVLGNALLPII